MINRYSSLEPEYLHTTTTGEYINCTYSSYMLILRALYAPWNTDE